MNNNFETVVNVTKCRVSHFLSCVFSYNTTHMQFAFLLTCHFSSMYLPIIPRSNPQPPPYIPFSLPLTVYVPPMNANKMLTEAYSLHPSELMTWHLYTSLQYHPDPDHILLICL